VKELQQKCDDVSWWQAPGVCLLIGNPDDGSLFFQTLRTVVQAKLGEDISSLYAPSTQADLLAFKENIFTTFLGQKKTYWLFPAASLTAKLKKQLFDVLATYTGPHTICFLADESELPFFSRSKHVRSFALPATVSGRGFAGFCTLIGNDLAHKKATHLQQVLAPYSFSLKTACVLAQHLAYVPLKVEGAVDEVLLRTIPYQGSLSALSDLFFKRSWKQFFMRWDKIYFNYSEMFWISFFCDQVWRAYFAIHAMNNNDTASARRYAYRLPSSFLSRSWRFSTKNELYSLYQSLYFFDIRAKNSTSFSVRDAMMVTSYVRTK